MRKLIFVLSLLVGNASFAAVTVQCASHDKKANFTYSEDKLSYCLKGCSTSSDHAFEGDRIKKDSSVMGTTLTVEESFAPDKEHVYVSLIMPDMNLAADLPTVTFSTKAVVTVSKTSFVGPGGVKGLVQNSKFIHLNCTATLN